MRKIPLNQGKFALIDDEDFERVNQYKWHLFKCGTGLKEYVATNKYVNGIRKVIKLHRFILRAKKKQIMDHINGNGLDNRKANLRFCTQQQNAYNRKLNKNNTSGYKGISFKKDIRLKYKQWIAYINVEKKRKYLGYFRTKEEAMKVRIEAEKQYYGEFARDVL